MESLQDLHLGEGPGSVDTTGLCLLSLDGGGVRGLSTLYILKIIFTRLNDERSRTGSSHVKPCEVFDLIGGTSTGGLLAIMLGRLEMDIDECISCYTELMKTVFARKKSLLPLTWSGKIKERFDSSKLRVAVEKVIAGRALPKQELFNDEIDRGCRVFVCATDSDTTGATRLRSYNLPEELDICSTICEAALATSAATSFFEPVHIKERKFVDGALKANNPVVEVEDEASNIWCSGTAELKPLVKCFLSIGTGHPGIRAIQDDLAGFLAGTLREIATETETTAESFISRWRQQYEQKRYFRFNVDHGLQGIGLEEYKEQGTIEAATDKYLKHTEQKARVRYCIQNLKEKQNRTATDFAASVNCLSGNIYWMVKRPTNPHFTGRDGILRDLEATIQNALRDTSGSNQCRIVISGVGGQGKSEICLQLANRVRQMFWGVFWVDVSAKSSATNDFLNIASKLSIPAQSLEEAKQGLANVKESWLLVLDNADDPEFDYQHYFPAGLFGVMILTSRNPDCHQYATSTQPVKLEGLQESDAQELLFRAANIPLDQQHLVRKDAQSVAALLQSHPLALIQAGAYVWCGHCRLADYPRVFERQRKRLLKYRPSQAQSRYGDVYATFEASAEVLQSSQTEAAKDALQLLPILGICAPSRLPQPLFQIGWKGAKRIIAGNATWRDDDHTRLTQWQISQLPSLLQAPTDVWDRFRLVEAISLLTKFSLVSTDTYNGFESVSMHPLTNAWARDRLDRTAQDNAWLATGCLVAISRRRYEPLWMDHGRQLQPHLEALISWDVGDVFASQPRPEITAVMMNCGWQLNQMRMDSKLLHFMSSLRTYLTLDEVTVDPNWLDVYDLTGRNLRNCGQIREAVRMQQQIVRIKEQTLPEDDSSRLSSQHELASAYLQNGEVEKAIPLLEQVLQVRDHKLPEDNPSRLASQHQLAYAYLENKQVEKAVSLLEHVVQIREQTLAKGHPDRLASQHILAGAYLEIKQVEKAVALLEHVVQIREQTLAKSHPDRLASQHELARAYLDSDQVEKSVALLEHVVQIREQTLAKSHPDRLVSQQQLAIAYLDSDQVEKSVALLEHVVQIREQTQAETHPERLVSQHQLAISLWLLNRREAALQMMKHVVEVQREVLDENHQRRINSEEVLAFFEDEMKSSSRRRARSVAREGEGRDERREKEAERRRRE